MSYYYAVAIGRTAGIFTSWPDCKAQVEGFAGALYKKCNSPDEAQIFMENFDCLSSIRPLRRSVKNSIIGNYSPKSSIPLPQYKADPDEDSKSSDYGDDLSTVLTKQMDDIEKRLRSFEKRLEKILNRNSSKSSEKENSIEPQQKKNHTYSHLEFEKDDDGFTIVYTDGACSSNGKHGARAGYGLYWGNGHPLNTSEPVTGQVTNSCGEIQAAKHAIKQAIQNGIKKLAIHTDSKFLINTVTKWMPDWKRNGWKLKSGEPVKNETDLKELDELQNQVKIKWNYIKARGIHGHKMANQFARKGMALYKINN